MKYSENTVSAEATPTALVLIQLVSQPPWAVQVTSVYFKKRVLYKSATHLNKLVEQVNSLRGFLFQLTVECQSGDVTSEIFFASFHSLFTDIHTPTIINMFTILYVCLGCYN